MPEAVNRRNSFKRFGRGIALLAVLAWSLPLAAQQAAPAKTSTTPSARSYRGVTTRDYNRKLQQLVHRSDHASLNAYAGDYRIGPEDLLQISVLEAPDLSRTVRVSDNGQISLPLLGTVQAAGLTARGLQAVLANLLSRSYMKNPQVSVFVQQMRSHPVAVFGAVEKPGVYQIRAPKTLIEVLSLAQGLAKDAGDTVIVMRHAGDPVNPAAASPAHGSTATPEAHLQTTSANSPPSSPLKVVASDPVSIKVSLKRLLNSSNPRYNVLVYPGDVVKVTRAGIVYVVGAVRRPGGFLLKTNENISVLQALALAEGLTSTSQRKRARIILAGEAHGSRTETAIDLQKILEGKSPDPLLHSRDILFVPSSGRKAALHAFYRTTEGIAAAVSGAAIYRW